MQALLVTAAVVALAEFGDKTQMLALVLAARFRRPAPILLGILCTTLANHALAAAVGRWVAAALGPQLLRWVLGVAFIAIALWTLKADRFDPSPGATGGLHAAATSARWGAAARAAQGGSEGAAPRRYEGPGGSLRIFATSLVGFFVLDSSACWCCSACSPERVGFVVRAASSTSRVHAPCSRYA
ncbi:MAG TPA: TMEM165/GDT1 family protein [Steroidobacteraceae bacterium]|nr:TMEM165/GDT1 family protein [Steroidobacteraceae bacterium]